MAISSVKTDRAPAAIGPYSQAVKAGAQLYCSGQIPLCPDGSLVAGDITQQTEQVLQNLGAVLEAGGSHFDRVVKTTIYLADLADFAIVNEIYARYFTAIAPARATVEVSGLPKGVRVEIDAIALID